jgi:prepilin-type N-terminal cleavage/methylation domain-containing protein
MNDTQIRVHSQQGFSLLELMVALAVLSIVMTAIVGVFSRSSRLYTTQNAAASLQQEVRAAVEFMAREMRMAGYDPGKTNDFDLEVTTATRVRFSRDLDGSEKIDDGIESSNSSTVAFPKCEQLTFRYSTGTNSVQVICGNQPAQTLIGGVDPRVSKVTNLKFEYLNSSGNPTNLNSEVMAIVITLTAQAPAGAEGMITRSYSTRVELRNAVANSLI